MGVNIAGVRPAQDMLMAVVSVERRELHETCACVTYNRSSTCASKAREERGKRAGKIGNRGRMFTCINDALRAINKRGYRSVSVCDISAR